MSEFSETTEADANYIPKSALLALPLLFVVAITVYEVICRYIFGRPTIWANELALFISALFYLAAGAYVMVINAHLRITVVYDAVPGWVRRIFDVITLVATLIFCGGIAWFGAPSSWQAMITFERFGTAWNAPIPAIIKPAVVVAAAVMAIFAIIHFIRSLRRPYKNDVAKNSID